MSFQSLKNSTKKKKKKAIQKNISRTKNKFTKLLRVFNLKLQIPKIFDIPFETIIFKLQNTSTSNFFFRENKKKKKQKH